MMCSLTQKQQGPYKVNVTPQDSSFIPTLAVTLWLGWFGGSLYIILFTVFTTNSIVKSILSALILLSLVLPRNFPKTYGTWIGNWIARNAQLYFGIKTIFEDYHSIEKYSSSVDHNNNNNNNDDNNKSETKGVIFAMEPHDILPYSVFVFNPSLQLLPGSVGQNGTALITGAAFQIPFMKQVFTWVGANPVDKRTFRSRLQQEKSLSFCPGGVQEVIYMDDQRNNDTITLFLMKRKGFIKLALENGSPIVPVFSFHLDGSYGYYIPKGKIVTILARMIGFVPMIFWGRFLIPFGIPYPKQISVVFGKAIDVPKLNVEDITNEIIDKYHGMFISEMMALFERHKHNEGYGDKTLKII